MRNIILNQKMTATILVGIIFLQPVFALAQVGIPCGDLAAGQKMCGFNDLITLVNNVIHFIIYYIAVPLAALGFMWVGGNLVLNQNKESAWSDAKEKFWDIGRGFGIILGAYVLIKMALFAFLSEEQINFMSFMLDLN
ncbi:MAG: hypothetical protein WAV98_02230 [Minisyncoccia bacterium]